VVIRTDVSEESIDSISGLGTTLKVTSSVFQVLDTANVRSSLILSTLMMEAIRAFETSHPRSYPRKNLKPYIGLTGWAL
jgi:hypothetical protein